MVKDSEWIFDNLTLFYQSAEGKILPLARKEKRHFEAPGISVIFSRKFGTTYEVVLNANFDTNVKIILPTGIDDGFALIPCNIYGDNNHAHVKDGQLPILTEDIRCDTDSNCWEFRADRASHPVSILMGRDRCCGISINPYTSENGVVLRNGLIARKKDKIGVSIGYTNYPVTFVYKQSFGPSTAQLLKKGKAEVTFYEEVGGQEGVNRIIRNVYARYREHTYTPRKTYEEAVRALIHCFNEINYQESFQNYTNLKCENKETMELVPWRQLNEIGWTGGSVIAYPMLAAKKKLKNLTFRKEPEKILDEICSGYQESSGFLSDVADPKNPGNVNGWWSYFGLTKDKHCAYTNGSAVYYLLKSYLLEPKNLWLNTALKVLNSVLCLQRADGAFGFSYETERKAVCDYDGFAGCWFAAAAALAFKITGNCLYLSAAEKALDYYSCFVRGLCCFGTPMDTWKSVDQEGNIAFIKASVCLYEQTNVQKYLDYAVLGAQYEYTWRYAFAGAPECKPLKDSTFNACGGSVTSVSNPHIHPMGMLLNQDLIKIGEYTHDPYHVQRGEDGYMFAMNIMELYPDVSGYGQYGVLTERYCPSDGLLTETFADGSPSSVWFSYNGWAAANVLEALTEKL